MAVFAVMTSNASPDLGPAIARTFAENFYAVAPGQYLVAGQGLTTKDVTERLGAESGQFGQIVVLSVTSFYGWHKKDIWEWLQVKS